MKVEHEEAMRSLQMYVRLGDDGGITDSRQQASNEILALGSEMLLEMMGEVPYDLAAILSHRMGVSDGEETERVMRQLQLCETDQQTITSVQFFMARGEFPLVFADVKCAQVIRELSGTDLGCILYATLTLLLHSLRSEPGLRTLLFPRSKRVMEEHQMNDGIVGRADGIDQESENEINFDEEER